MEKIKMKKWNLCTHENKSKQDKKNAYYTQRTNNRNSICKDQVCFDVM